MDNTSLLILPAVLAVATFALAAVALVVVRRRRRRAALASTLTWITDLELPFETHVHGEAPSLAVDVREPVQIRALRAQVRTLEAALEQEQTRDLVQRATVEATDQLTAYRRQVELTLRAISRQVEGDSEAERIAARIAAAVERLADPEDFSRPTLSPAGAVAVLSRPTSPAVLHAVETKVETAAPAQQVEEPVEDLSPTAEADLAPAPQQPEVVLPVPPMAESEANRRGRRRFRGSAA